MQVVRGDSSQTARPSIFALLYWTTLVTAITVWVIDVPDIGRPYGPVPVMIATLALVTAWIALPWDLRVSPTRKWVLFAYLATTLGFCLVTSFLWALPLYAIPVATGVFLFGFRRGIALATAPPLLVFTTTYLM